MDRCHKTPAFSADGLKPAGGEDPNVFALSCTVKKILCQACPAPHALVRGLAGKPDRVPSCKSCAVQHMGADAETSELECRGKTGYTPSNNQHTVIRHGFLSPLQTGRASALLFIRL
jgi:hypothetical protein